MVRNSAKRERPQAHNRSAVMNRPGEGVLTDRVSSAFSVISVIARGGFSSEVTVGAAPGTVRILPCCGSRFPIDESPAYPGTESTRLLGLRPTVLTDGNAPVPYIRLRRAGRL